MKEDSEPGVASWLYTVVSSVLVRVFANNWPRFLSLNFGTMVDRRDSTAGIVNLFRRANVKSGVWGGGVAASLPHFRWETGGRASGMVHSSAVATTWLSTTVERRTNKSLVVMADMVAKLLKLSGKGYC